MDNALFTKMFLQLCFTPNNNAHFNEMVFL